MTQSDVTLLVLASYFKGGRFIEAAHAEGARVVFITREKIANDGWPMDSVSERFLMPQLSKQPDITHAVSYLARERVFDRIVPLDDYDVLTAAQLREHFRLPGLDESTTRRFRDKLAMRVAARDAGLPVPDFVHVLNYDHLRDFMGRVPPPWVLKPRAEAGAMGIKKVYAAAELWGWLDALGDAQSNYLLEQFLPGEVFHVDGIVSGGKHVFQAVQKYGRPPMAVAHGGGVFASYTLPGDDPDHAPLLALYEAIVDALGMTDGVTHTEFIKDGDGRLYFLETAARVGGAGIDRLIEAASGLNLWGEWARQEITLAQGRPYALPPARAHYAGLLVCLARQAWPDLSGYDAPEVVWRMDKKQHAGLIVAGEDPERIQALLAEYGRRFEDDFVAVAPPLDRPPA